MDSNQVIAIAGILGTIAGTATGAYIAASTSKTLDERRENREKRAEARRARAAARMIRADLLVCAASLKYMLDKGVWDARFAHLPVENWRTHGHDLALAVDDGGDWNRIELAMGGAAEHLLAIRDDLPRGPLVGEVRDRIEQLHTTLRAADKALGPLAGDPHALRKSAT